MKVYVLAAGKGTRMGGPKLFVQHNGAGFLERILTRCEEGSNQVCLVLQHTHQDKLHHALPMHWQAYAKESNSALRLVTVSPNAPMWHSLSTAVRSSKTPEGCWVWPVDAPFISQSGWHSARQVVSSSPQRVWKLRSGGKNGHPVWLPSWLVPALCHHDWPGGLQSLLKTLAPHEVAYLDMSREDLQDKNTPADLSHQVAFLT